MQTDLRVLIPEHVDTFTDLLESPGGLGLACVLCCVPCCNVPIAFTG